MNDGKTDDQGKSIELEYDIDAPPHKVWRAISIPAFRENWLPKEALVDSEAASLTPGQEVCYRMRESDPPFLESAVTFRIVPNAAGGTSLRIIHELTDMRFDRMSNAAANNDNVPLMLAA
ncbi:MAG: SRPBCC domain-containing protein [Pseudomonadota bacterium]|uniref:SRPBCC family protein n=1 Tax=Sphingomonas sp. ERG5 TaxID=1381597 RepID=UPI00054C4099|nr:SRPBCC domain-containing protein [Sphingomonas sp. ERG5]